MIYYNVQKSDELKEGYIKAYNGMSSLKFEMLISQQDNIQSHISIQKKGRIPCDYKNDKEANDYLNNIPGPFHKSIFDLTIRNQELRLKASRIQARYEDFNLFSYEMFENPNFKEYNSLLNDFPFKNMIQYNNTLLSIKTIEEKPLPETIYESISSTTKPSSSESSNDRENIQFKDRKKFSDENKIAYTTNHRNSSLNKYVFHNTMKKENLRNKKQRQQYNSDSQEFGDSEEYSSDIDKKRPSNQSYLIKRKNNKLIVKNNNQNLSKKQCTQNSKLYFDQFQSVKNQNNNNISNDNDYHLFQQKIMIQSVNQNKYIKNKEIEDI